MQIYLAHSAGSQKLDGRFKTSQTNNLRMRLTFCILTLFIAISAYSQNCCEIELVKIESVEQLSSEFKRLKTNGNRDCCRNYGSGLMKSMEMLSDSIEIHTNEERIIQLMGLPDNYATKDHPIEHHFTQLGKEEKVLIYYWRGMHDFVYFVLMNKQLISKQWYYALE